MVDVAVVDASSSNTDLITQKLRQIRSHLASLGKENVRVVAVSKGHGMEKLSAAIAAGCTDIGESYAQELLRKHEAVLINRKEPLQVHFIGGLQSNKIRKLSSIVDIWQSVDRFDLGREIAKWSPGAQVMVQVAIAGEQSKRGCSPESTPALVERLSELELNVVGLMGIGPAGEPEQARPGFALLRNLVDLLGLSECSMGMTSDLDVALQEGSTMVRIGTDLFGPRPPNNLT